MLTSFPPSLVDSHKTYLLSFLYAHIASYPPFFQADLVTPRS